MSWWIRADVYLSALYLWLWRPTDAPRARRYSSTPLTLTSGASLRARVRGISGSSVGRAWLGSEVTRPEKKNAGDSKIHL